MRLCGTGVCYSEPERPKFTGDPDEYNPDNIAKKLHRNLELNPEVQTCCICGSVPVIECRILPEKVIWHVNSDLSHPSEFYKRESTQIYFHIYCKNCKTELRSENYKTYSTTVNEISRALSIKGWNNGDVLVLDDVRKFSDVIKNDIIRVNKYKELGLIHPNDSGFYSHGFDLPYAGHSYSDDKFYYSFTTFIEHSNCKILAKGGMVVVESDKTKKKSYYIFRNSHALRDESYQNMDAYVCDCFNYIKYKYEFIKPIITVINGQTINLIENTDELILWKRNMYSQIEDNIKIYFKNWMTDKTTLELEEEMRVNKLTKKHKKCKHCIDGIMKLVDNFTNFQCSNCCFTEKYAK